MNFLCENKCYIRLWCVWAAIISLLKCHLFLNLLAREYEYFIWNSVFVTHTQNNENPVCFCVENVVKSFSYYECNLYLFANVTS